jgi:hypothetical protein
VSTLFFASSLVIAQTHFAAHSFPFSLSLPLAELPVCVYDGRGEGKVSHFHKTKGTRCELRATSCKYLTVY